MWVFFINYYSLSTKRRRSASVVAAKAITKRTIQMASSQRINQLKEMRVKPNTQMNVNWAVAAYNRWRNERLESNEYDYAIHSADINNPASLQKMNLVQALCYFIPEITKVNGEALSWKNSLSTYCESTKVPRNQTHLLEID